LAPIGTEGGQVPGIARDAAVVAEHHLGEVQVHVAGVFVNMLYIVWLVRTLASCISLWLSAERRSEG